MKTYYGHHTSQYGDQKFSSLKEAKHKCNELSYDECAGITLIENLGFELRKGNDLIPSPDNVISYARPGE